ncbi:hypothetical protein AB0M44_02375 [Streptosporangium subroseum]|uniref:hypothetical protein n=1 Tax=Streptosporangium subroseum TaxID=106412 RepID=UPI003427BDC6
MSTRSRYASRRVYLVPDDLSELTGPVAGVVELPTHLDWSEQHVYDLTDDSHLGLMYERVIREAVHHDDLRTYLNGRVLIRIWPRLYLPIQARQAWEARFPDLVRAA